jgi:Flp pilus assembly pilin Flp
MKLFQKAVDEFKTGNFTDGFKLAWQAIVEQAKDTANSIYVNIVAAFKTVGDFIKDQFKSSGPLVMAITSAFDYVSGYIKKVVSGSLADTFTSLGPAFSRIADGLKQSSEAGAKQAELALQRIPVAARAERERSARGQPLRGTPWAAAQVCPWRAGKTRAERKAAQRSHALTPR